MAEPLIPFISNKVFSKNENVIANLIRDQYNIFGKSFWKIYNELILPFKGKPEFMDVINVFNYVRRIVIYDLYPDLNYAGIKSGIEIPYWNGYNGVYPTWQISSESTGLRLIPWSWKNSQYMLRGNKWAGEMFFAPMMPLTPADQLAYKNGGIKATKLQIDKKVVSENGIYYYEMLDHDLAFVYSIQYILDILVPDQFNMMQKRNKNDAYPLGIDLYVSCFVHDNRADEAKSFFSNLNVLVVPPYKPSLLDKIVGYTSIGIATVIAVVTAGAGSPLLAAAVAALTGKIIKQAGSVITPDIPNIQEIPPPPDQPPPGKVNDLTKMFLPIAAVIVAFILIDQNSKR